LLLQDLAIGFLLMRISLSMCLRQCLLLLVLVLCVDGTIYFGNVLRFLGKQKFYLKNALVIEQLAKVDTIVLIKQEFDQ
jgi:Cu+-exporting ATPase